MPKTTVTRLLPLLPLRDIVVFPHMLVPLYVGRSRSIAAVDEAMRGGREILLSAQKSVKINDPLASDIHLIGCISKIMQHIKRPDGTIKILVEGRHRGRITKFIENEHSLVVEVEDLNDDEESSAEQRALLRTVHDSFENYARLSKRLQPDVLTNIRSIVSPGRLVDTITAHMPIKHHDKQNLLQIFNVYDRLEKLYEMMQAEIEIIQVERKIRTRVKKQMERTEKEYYLNEQMRAIQKELGERDEFKSEIGDVESRLREKDLPAEVRAKVDKEIKKLKMMSPMSAEATVVRSYIDWCLSLPFNEFTDEKIDIALAERILDKEHYGLRRPKERIFEYLAVQKLVDHMRGPILCLVGPPGVGKTSLARSIAHATGRAFVRLSLGGVRDEAEIRGHRRTYIGALPGKIIQSLKRAGTSNPVFLLDEIDKMSNDFRGDPAAALLEVLDPEQNTAFNDHYLDLDYDLSRVMFICTANSMQGIPGPLEDRLETIRLAGYTELEKLAIAKRYLIPKERRENGLENVHISWPESATKTIVQLYTREAGVRTLERKIAAVCRKIAKQVVRLGPQARFKVSPARVKHYLGVPCYRDHCREELAEIGMATGLAWTEQGGEILQIEVTTMPGRGKMLITGKLGDVMQESAQAAFSYVRSRATSWGLAPDFYTNIDIHIHVPDGATPKDGPSAGITMATALVSALTKIPVRHDVAMTGEVTLRGRVLPIGGLKEKALAAHRARIKHVLLPQENEKDLEEIPASVARALRLTTVSSVDAVLQHALLLEDSTTFFAQFKGRFPIVGHTSASMGRLTPSPAVTPEAQVVPAQ